MTEKKLKPLTKTQKQYVENRIRALAASKIRKCENDNHIERPYIEAHVNKNGASGALKLKSRDAISEIIFHAILARGQYKDEVTVALSDIVQTPASYTRSLAEFNKYMTCLEKYSDAVKETTQRIIDDVQLDVYSDGAKAIGDAKLAIAAVPKNPLK